ncbi:MAG: hypothetical protein ABFS56_12030 [Pseudomonadota bacterium]
MNQTLLNFALLSTTFVENGVSNRLPDKRRVKNMLKCRLFIEKVKEADWKIRKTVSSR